MLIFTRRKNESLVLGFDIGISVVEVRGDKVRLAINVPKEVPVHRQELFDAIHGREPFVPPQSSPDEAALLQAVLESPEDDGVRLIYADWLEERGDPRGEFIRLQCHLAHLPADHEDRKTLAERETTLLTEFGFAWRQRLPPILRCQPFVRGFVEQASMGTSDFLVHAEQIFSLAPIRHLHVKYLWYDGQDFGKFVASPYLARLCTLDLSGVRAMDGDVNLLADSPHLNLRTLILKENLIGDSGARRLAVCSRLATLTNLDLTHNEITVAGALALATSPYLANARIDLSNNQFGEQGVQILRERIGGERVES